MLCAKLSYAGGSELEAGRWGKGGWYFVQFCHLKGIENGHVGRSQKVPLESSARGCKNVFDFMISKRLISVLKMCQTFTNKSYK